MTWIQDPPWFDSSPCTCQCCRPRTFTTSTLKLIEPEPLSEEDVERIARKLAEYLRDKL